MTRLIYDSLIESKRLGGKQFAVLIDPDKAERDSLLHLTDLAESVGVDFIFIGGSTLLRDNISECVLTVKCNCSIPIVLFPGSNKQIDSNADALLLLSLISGRNAEWLINQHVEAAFHIKQSGLEVIPTGYILIDGDRETSVTYVSQTRPIPSNQTEIAAATALAGQQLGLKLIYMDAGSGALRPVSSKMIKAVKAEVDLPLVVGGGIDSEVKARKACEATGIYYEGLAWHLFQQKQTVAVVLPNKAKRYLQSLGLKSKNDTIDAKGLALMGAVASSEILLSHCTNCFSRSRLLYLASKPRCKSETK